MAITDFPWFKIYAAETLSDENFTSWGPAERGAWFTLLCHCWKEGSIPSDEIRLARLCGTDAHAMHELWPSIADRFHKQPNGDRLICVRLEFERQQSLDESEGKSQHGKRAAHARWSKYKEEMHGQCSGIPQAMPDDAPQPQPQPQPILPPTPKGEPAKASRKPRRSKVHILGGYSDDVVSVVNPLLEVWPDQDPCDGRKTGAALAPFCQAVHQILENNADVTPEILLEAGNGYINSTRNRFASPQAFFGTGREGKSPEWVGYVRVILHERKELAHAI